MSLMDDLIKAVDKSKTTVKVCVPSADYYRRPEDWESKDLTYVDPEKLKTALKAIIDRANS